MIVASLLALQAVVQPPSAATPPRSPSTATAGVPPLTDWSLLPVYPLPRQSTIADASAYVRAEVEAGRCVIASPPGPDGTRITATAAVLIGSDGVIRRIVPQAINCPTVEQFTVGYLSSLTRGQGKAVLRLPPGWYRATISYRW